MVSSYAIATDGGFVCLLCGRKSFSPNDILMKYCGNCKIFHEEEPSLCDFCMLPSPVVAIIKAASKLRGMLNCGDLFIDDDQLWNACAECNRLIEAEEWEVLMNRGIAGTVRRNPQFRDAAAAEVLRAKVVFMYSAVFGEKFKP